MESMLVEVMDKVLVTQKVPSEVVEKVDSRDSQMETCSVEL